ncbi:MAG: hypothetical protein V5A33_05425, partial [Halobacteriales archaeon]
VRRYMIDHGIHEPNSYDTAGDDGSTSREGDGEPAGETDDAAGPTTEREPADEQRPESGEEPTLEGLGTVDPATDPGASTDEPAVEPPELEPSDLATDGIGLPEDVTVDGFVEAVQRANTIYEVETELDLAREEAREMLEQLDLIDYVAGRLSTNERREVSREQVVERLRRHARAR